MFLVLSGFLISRSVRRRRDEGTFTLGRYMKDRFARIYVPLIPLIPIVLLGDRVFLGPGLESRFVEVRHGWFTVASNVLMLQDNWTVQVIDRVFDADLSRRSLGSAAPWWTVALEWWIYVAFGAGICCRLRGLSAPRLVGSVRSCHNEHGDGSGFLRSEWSLLISHSCLAQPTPYLSL